MAPCWLLIIVLQFFYHMVKIKVANLQALYISCDILSIKHDNICYILFIFRHETIFFISYAPGDITANITKLIGNTYSVFHNDQATKPKERSEPHSCSLLSFGFYPI